MSLIEPPSFILLVKNSASGFDSTTVVYIICIAFLLFISALMSSSESAFFSLRPSDNEDLKKENSSRSKLILGLLAKPKDLLATILITNNFVNVGIVILSTFILNDIYPPTEGSELQRFLLEVVGITFLILLLGEVVPKVFAAQNTMRVVRWMSYPLYFLGSVPPLSWLKIALVKGTNFIQKRTKSSVKVNQDELEQALALTREESSSEEDHKILEGIVKFGKTEASQIMTPRIEVEAIDDESTFEEVMQTVLEAGYSRMPIFNESPDNIVGILYIKDLLPHLGEGVKFDWKSIIRKPFFIPENKKINDLLQEFRNMRMHMAVVVDEYGGASGIVTLEDILEEIVGDITDEFDDHEIAYTKLDEHTIIFEGRTSLNDFYKIIGESYQNAFESVKGEAETIGGLVLENAGRILKNNEFVFIENVKFIVESSDKKRMKTIKIKLP
ncbi:MAG: gliding motility-associated protein GldE [Flavobacteriales bacterium]